MARNSPMNSIHEKNEAEFFPYGRLAGATDGESEPAIRVVSHYNEIEAEYAAIRKGAGLMDCPQRGTIVLDGADRIEFLNRLLTNDLAPLGNGRCVRAFWLNRKGRIDADLTLMAFGEETMVDLDVTTAASTCRTLNEFLFGEEVTIADVTEDWHTLALHGPQSADVLAGCVDDASSLNGLDAAHGAGACSFNGEKIVAVRSDLTGEVGFELHVPVGSVLALYERLLSAGARANGWHAFNMARIEGGTPVFNVDFGPDSVPHETGMLDERVSFTKGCYLGQEVVARMQNLGHPSKKLVGLRLSGEHIPITGSPVIDPNEDGKNVEVGAVTSAAPSPMLSGSVIAFAMVKHAMTVEGKELVVRVGDESVSAVVHGLRFWDAGVGAGGQ